jgi:hypothetical protein
MNGKGYEITDTRKIDQLTQGSNIVVKYRVFIVTDRGSTGSIDVSAPDWTVEKLRAILAEFAAQLDLAYTVTES